MWPDHFKSKIMNIRISLGNLFLSIKPIRRCGLTLLTIKEIDSF